MGGQKVLSRRGFLRMSGAVTTGVMLAACAPTKPAAETAQPSDAQTTAAAPTPAAAQTAAVAPTPAPAQAVTIQYWVGWGGTTVDALKACADKFTARHPDVKINVIGDSSNEKILTAIAGGTAPEMASNLDYMALIARGVCMPQTEWINASPVVKKEDFHKEAWKLFTWKNDIYGIPGVESAPRESLCYNVDLVAEAGLDPKAPPQTWDEVYAWHQALTKFDAAGNAVLIGIDPLDDMGGSYGWGDPWMWAGSWGFDYFDEENFKFHLDRPEVTEVFATIKMFYDFVGVEKMAAFRKGYGTWTFSPTAGVPAGAQAMCITGGWSPGWLSLSAPDKHFAYTWMPVPASRKGKKVQMTGGHSPIIFKDAKGAAQAYPFAEYLTCDDEASDILWERIGFQPARISWWQKVDASRYEGFDFFVKAATEFDELWPDEPNPVASNMGNEWVKAREAVIYGTIKPEQAGKQMQEALTKALQDFLSA